LSPPPLVVELEWQGELRLRAKVRTLELLVDGNGRAAPSPVEALAVALAGCMATDVVDILQKGRLPLAGLTARLSARRAEQDPRRFLAVDLHFVVKGKVPADRVERAIALSREKYCSVWHSLRQDIDFKVTFDVGG
jgi:putative redox protein